MPVFFFKDTATTEIYTLSLHDALPISMLAGMAFANAPVAAVHALAYPIGAIFHVPHGLSNALVLMGVLRFNLPEAQGLYAELGPVLDPSAQGLPAAEQAQRFVDRSEERRVGKEC